MDGKCRVEQVRHLSLPLPSSCCEDSEDELTPILGATRERQLAYFKHRHIIYLYEEAEGRFLRLSQWERGRSFDTLHDHSMGLSSDEHRARLAASGGRLVVGDWWWATGGGRLVVGGWWWATGGGRLVVGDWWWAAGGGQLVVVTLYP